MFDTHASTESAAAGKRPRSAGRPSCVNVAVQNRHAMRADVRAAFDEAIEVAGADRELCTRLERFFADLREPLVELYGPDPASRAGGLLRGMARTATERSAELRASSTTSARSRRTGCTASTPSAT